MNTCPSRKARKAQRFAETGKTNVQRVGGRNKRTAHPVESGPQPTSTINPIDRSWKGDKKTSPNRQREKKGRYTFSIQGNSGGGRKERNGDGLKNANKELKKNHSK